MRTVTVGRILRSALPSARLGHRLRRASGDGDSGVDANSDADGSDDGSVDYGGQDGRRGPYHRDAGVAEKRRFPTPACTGSEGPSYMSMKLRGFNHDIRRHDNVFIVTLRGHLDVCAARGLEDEMTALLDDGVERVVLDCQELSY